MTEQEPWRKCWCGRKFNTKEEFNAHFDESIEEMIDERVQ